jgi:hypothetical protein
MGPAPEKAPAPKRSRMLMPSDRAEPGLRFRRFNDRTRKSSGEG